MEEGLISVGFLPFVGGRVHTLPGLFPKVESQGQVHDEAPSYVLAVSGPSQGAWAWANVF